MQNKHLYSYGDYKKYLNDRLDSSPKGRGSRSEFARSIQCQTAYVSSVLRGHIHFTPEQGEEINRYLGHSEDESDYFLLLLQFQRAGTETLKNRLQKQMDRILEHRFSLKKRLAITTELTLEDQTEFYSSWQYAAVHALISIPGYENINAIREYLHLDQQRAVEIVEFLLRTGLITQERKGFKIGKSKTHLGSDSPLISKHHLNWRILTIQRLASVSNKDLHYSSVISLSQKDAETIKEMMIDFIKTSKSIIRDSKEETLQCFTMDFFKI